MNRYLVHMLFAVVLMGATAAHAGDLRPAVGPTVLPPVPAMPQLTPSWTAAPKAPVAINLLGEESGAVLWLAPLPLPVSAVPPADPLGPAVRDSEIDDGWRGGRLGFTLVPGRRGPVLTASVGMDRRRTDLALSVDTSASRVGVLYLYEAEPGKAMSDDTPLFILPRNGAALLGLDSGDEARLHTYGLYGDLSLGDKFGVHWAVGYAAVVQGDQTEKKAWEYNVGIAYRVLSNLMYEAHFGYLTTDDDGEVAAEQLAAESPAAIEQVYLITNKVTMRF